ncbi:MAG: hypothetical protein ACK4RK_11060 [Gemmataceae bacterium]
MRTHARWWMMSSAVVALAVLLWASNSNLQADDEAEMRAAVLKLASAIEKGDAAAVKKQSADIAKKYEEVEDIMYIMALRRVTAAGKVTGGIGVGDKPGEITPDGIERVIIEFGKAAPNAQDLAKNEQALLRAAYISAAIGEISKHQAPSKRKADWIKWSDEMAKESIALAEAIKKKDPGAVNKAAFKLDGTCAACHSVFRQ